jgi:hypothetical protein
MMSRLAFLLFTAFAALAQTPDHTWVLDSSSLTYHMTHPVHEVEGTSHAAKGKGICHAGTCAFLVAAPVRTFDSGDTNRDLHMLQVVRGAEFPVITVKFQVPESAIALPALDADLEITFAGQTAHYSHVRFQQEIQNREHRIVGIVPATLTDFKIDPPRFLTVPIRNEIPVRVDATWHAE